MTKVKKKSMGKVEKRGGEGRERTASLSGVESTESQGRTDSSGRGMCRFGGDDCRKSGKQVQRETHQDLGDHLTISLSSS